jgi:hypothetical protein
LKTVFVWIVDPEYSKTAASKQKSGKSIVGRNHANLAPIYFISDAFFPANFFFA